MSLVALLFIIIVVAIIVTLVDRSALDATFKAIIWWLGVVGAGVMALWYIWNIINGGTVRVF